MGMFRTKLESIERTIRRDKLPSEALKYLDGHLKLHAKIYADLRGLVKELNAYFQQLETVQKLLRSGASDDETLRKAALEVRSAISSLHSIRNYLKKLSKEEKLSR